MPHFGQRARLHGIRRLSAWRWKVICETPFPSSLQVIHRLGFLARNCYAAATVDGVMHQTGRLVLRSPVKDI